MKSRPAVRWKRNPGKGISWWVIVFVLCVWMAPVAAQTEEPAGQEAAKEETEPPPPSRSQVMEDLKREDYAYNPRGLIDPFVPFTLETDQPGTAATPSAGELEEESEPVEPPRPLTPLQRMTVTEIEQGLKAILWGEMGRRAIIEDSTGKGYIVASGTPVANYNGIITGIFKDRLVIRQEVWDRKAKKMVAKTNVVMLQKGE